MANNQDKEPPRYTEADKQDLLVKTEPEDRPELKDTLEAFCESVEVIIQTVNDIERAAALELVESPNLDLGSEQNPKKPVKLPHPMLRITLGMFAGYRCAVVQTEMGRDCGREVKKALLKCPKAWLILAIGVAWGNPKNNAKLGDVLCSNKIYAYRNMKFDNGMIRPHKDSREEYKPPDEIRNAFKQQSIWGAKPETKFECVHTNEGTCIYSKAHVGCFFSWEVLLNDKKMRNWLLDKEPAVVGGEMEGVQLLEIRTDIKEDVFSHTQFEVVIIKGTADFADGGKNDHWQLTAAKAAANYAKYCLTKFRENKGAGNPTSAEPHNQSKATPLTGIQPESTSQRRMDAPTRDMQPHNKRPKNGFSSGDTYSKRPKNDISFAADNTDPLKEIVDTTKAVELTKDMSSNWYEFGRALNVSYDFREELRLRNDNCERKLEAVIEKWKSSNNPNATWENFINALKKIRRLDIVSYVEEYLGLKQ